MRFLVVNKYSRFFSVYSINYRRQVIHILIYKLIYEFIAENSLFHTKVLSGVLLTLVWNWIMIIFDCKNWHCQYGKACYRITVAHNKHKYICKSAADLKLKAILTGPNIRNVRTAKYQIFGNSLNDPTV